ncbi:MAG: dTDP-4-dehydrorhamnose reductase [Ferruginibacter sp.]|nr:dTDP-4-dehydrorhamnose reductase [Ferruginibacter sp.]
MKILITGANGLLGQHLVKMLTDTTDHEIVATGRGGSRVSFSTPERCNYFPLEITDGMAVASFIEVHRPEIIVHAAAITQVDECEADEVACYNTNVTATRFLISAAAGVGARFIYISTDFVFDGLAGPYIETDIPGPINYYGSTKLAAERAVMDAAISWCIIRTVLVYGNILNGNRSNIISWVQKSLSEGKNIQVVSDQWRTPTYVEDLAKGILLAIEKNATGIFHISGEEMLSPYDMAMATADYLRLDKTLIEKVDATIFSQPARRPMKTGFTIDKAKRELGFQPLSFMEGLIKMVPMGANG